MERMVCLRDYSSATMRASTVILFHRLGLALAPASSAHHQLLGSPESARCPSCRPPVTGRPFPSLTAEGNDACAV